MSITHNLAASSARHSTIESGDVAISGSAAPTPRRRQPHSGSEVAACAADGPEQIRIGAAICDCPVRESGSN
jgi:hypothetical protein